MGVQTTGNFSSTYDRAYRYRIDLGTTGIQVHLDQVGTTAILAEAPQIGCAWSIGPLVIGKAVEAACTRYREAGDHGAVHVEQCNVGAPVVGPEAFFLAVVCYGTAGCRSTDGVVYCQRAEVDTPYGGTGIRTVEQLIIIVVCKVTDITTSGYEDRTIEGTVHFILEECSVATIPLCCIYVVTVAFYTGFTAGVGTRE